MQGAGYVNQQGQDPDFPMPDAPGTRSPQTQIRINGDLPPDAEIPGVHQNTSPQFLPVPQTAETGETGIETANIHDNLTP